MSSGLKQLSPGSEDHRKAVSDKLPAEGQFDSQESHSNHVLLFYYYYTEASQIPLLTWQRPMKEGLVITPAESPWNGYDKASRLNLSVII